MIATQMTDKEQQIRITIVPQLYSFYKWNVYNEPDAAKLNKIISELLDILEKEND
jgi:hypothetical protein